MNDSCWAINAGLFNVDQISLIGQAHVVSDD
jgi:hypothetical protein